MTKPVLDAKSLSQGEIVALHGPGATAALEALAAGPTRLGTVWRDGGLFPGLTVAEVVDTWRRWTLDPITRQEALWLTGLTGREQTRFENLSAVERRWLDLALALIGQADLLLLDEPTAALDPAARDEIWTLLRNLATRGVTIVLATRDPAEARRADHHHPRIAPAAQARAA